MSSELRFTARVACRLRESGLAGLADLLLVSSKPFALLGAQVFYIVEPFLGRSDGLRDLARLLEDPQQMDDLSTRLLRDESES